LQYFISEHFDNVVLLQPHAFDSAALRKLGECEHFDVVFVHNVKKQFKETWDEFIALSMHLGDYLIFDVNSGDVASFEPYSEFLAWSEQRAETVRLCFHKPKTGLTHTYWGVQNRKIAEDGKAPYRIESTFEHKNLVKTDGTQTDWVPGINLITALMLDIIYPTNAILRANMKKMKTLEHNDLVMSNMIVQGNKLVAIDFADSRRKADPKKCLKATIKVFNWYSRLTESEKLFDQYCKSLRS
jgi:hypothetical protein